MKTTSLLKSLLLGALTALLIAVPIANHLQLSAAPIAAGLFLLPAAIHLGVTAYYGFTPYRATGLSFMAVQVENWVDYIEKTLFKDNEFLQYCHDESEHVLEGTVVHIPQAGAPSEVVKNRAVFPATAVRRTDTDVTYSIDSYTSTPRHLTNAEQKEVSYDKMNDCIGDDVAAIAETIAEDLLYKWAPTTAATILRTTGAVADGVALAPGATGTRKPLVWKDLRRAQSTMNKLGVPKKDRHCLIPEDMVTQLMDDPALTSSQLQLLVDLMEGQLAKKIAGFHIHTRANATIYDNTATPVPKLITAATAITDNLSVLCWHKNAVTKALGKIDFFENKKDATYYGDVYSAEVRCGGRKKRTNAEGVIAIIQTT